MEPKDIKKIPFEEFKKLFLEKCQEVIEEPIQQNAKTFLHKKVKTIDQLLRWADDIYFDTDIVLQDLLEFFIEFDLDTSKEQSLPNGTKVNFDLRDINLNDFEFESNNDLILFKKNMHQTATIIRLTTYTELGNKDYEYYTIKFRDGSKFDGISGYHLEKSL